MIYRYTPTLTHKAALEEKAALEAAGRTTSDLIAVCRRRRDQTKAQHQALDIWQVPYVVTMAEIMAEE
jgi:hypothetical protein